MPLGFAQPTPDAVWFPDGECVRAAPLDDGAAGAESFGCFLAALAAYAPFGVGREKRSRD